MPGWDRRISSRRSHPLVLVVGRHPHVDDGQIGLVLGDDGEQRLRIPHPREHLVPGVLEQTREALAEENGVLGDHDPHGSSASIRVPAPRGLWMRSVPPWASTRPVRPLSPVPSATVAPPLPSSATTSLSSPLATTASTWTCDGDRVLDGVRDRFADDEVGRRLDLRRKPLVGRFHVHRYGCRAGEIGQRRRKPLVQRGGRTPAAIVRRSSIASPISSTAESSAGPRIRASRGSDRCSRRRTIPSVTSRCWAPS